MDTIKVFLNEQTAKGTKQSTVTMYGQVLGRLDKFKTIEQINKADLVQYLNEFKCSDSTRMLHSIIIKKFFKDTGRNEVAAWLKPKRPHETLKSDDIPTADDVNKMLEATDSPYWKALIAVLYDSGARVGEVIQNRKTKTGLKYRDFEDTTEGLIVHIPTYKTASGFRKMILINSSQYVRNLQQAVNGKPDDFVFPIEYRYTHEVIRDIARAAGIKKKIHPHLFRHARATAAIGEMPEAIIRKQLGWSPNSTMISRYQHLNDDSVIEAQLGQNRDKKPTKLNPAEKVDLEPVYKKLEDDNESLKAKIAEMEHKEAERDRLLQELIIKMSKNV